MPPRRPAAPPGVSIGTLASHCETSDEATANNTATIVTSKKNADMGYVDRFRMELANCEWRVVKSGFSLTDSFAAGPSQSGDQFHQRQEVTDHEHHYGSAVCENQEGQCDARDQGKPVVKSPLKITRRFAKRPSRLPVLSAARESRRPCAARASRSAGSRTNRRRAISAAVARARLRINPLGYSVAKYSSSGDRLAAVDGQRQ